MELIPGSGLAFFTRPSRIAEAKGTNFPKAGEEIGTELYFFRVIRVGTVVGLRDRVSPGNGSVDGAPFGSYCLSSLSSMSKKKI